MGMAENKEIIFDQVESKIIEIRGQRVILDSDLARLYGVGTRDINQAVKNNPDKFPEGYIFILSEGEKRKVVEIFHHLGKIKFSPQLPKAFTEKGLYMLATILKSNKATETTLAIIETYSKFKNLSRNIKALSELNNEQTKNTILKKSGEIISEILEEDLKHKESETTIELNFAVLKFRHTFKNKNKK